MKEEHSNSDSTEGRVKDTELLSGADKYRMFFENSTDAMLMIQEYTFVDCNTATVEMLGYDNKEDLLNTHPSELSPEFQPDGKSSFDKAMEMMNTAYSKGTHRFEWDHKRRNGEVFPVEVSLTSIPSNGDKVLHTVWRDISERKEADIEREKLEEQLSRSQKMEAVGQLAGGVAHDFNNLLQVIQGYGEIAISQVENKSPLLQPIKQILNASLRAKNLVDQLLAYSRQQVLEMKHVYMNEVVVDIASMIHRVIGDHITLDVHFEENLGMVRADSGQLDQVLMNLCVNARDAMPDGGTITIDIKNTQLDDAFSQSHSWAKPGNYVLIQVADTGCGMSLDTLDNLFDPFYTTKEIGKGTGLGLATVYGLIRQHRGLIDVQSELGIGTTFNIYLPVVEGAIKETVEIHSEPVQMGDETILVADDEIAVRDLSRALLENAGYSVLTAVDGEDAIRVFDENKGKIHLALLDVMMPKLGGQAVQEHIHQLNPKVQVLFASGYSREGIHNKYVLDDGVQLLQKPFHEKELLRAVRTLLDS